MSEPMVAATTPAGPERSIWIIGSTQQSFAAAQPILRRVKDRFPRLRLVYTPRDVSVAAWLREHDPEGRVVAAPPTFAPRCRSAILRQNPRLMLLLDGVSPFEAALLRAARLRQIPVAMMATTDAPLSCPAPELLALVERFVAPDEESVAALAALGVPAARIVAIAQDEIEIATADALTSLLRRDLKALRSARRPLQRAVERLAVASVDHPWGRLLAGRRAERIATLDGLAAVLGHPRTILCLGNGPSSEDPRVEAVAFDSLFRVNHLWKGRGLLTDPDLVFTGSPDTIRAVHQAIFAIGASRHEARLLLAGLTRRARNRFRFVTLEQLGILAPQAAWGEATPTNGACMLATAVALRPQRIVIAGIDLFRHQAGAYPGDSTTPNAYTPRHEAALEERVILETLRAYRGEIVIVGDILRALWEETSEDCRDSATTAQL
jgi:hypothetical protein